MAQRFGRRRKRKLEDRIKYLESVAYGPCGPAPSDIESIDDLSYTSKLIRIDDDTCHGYQAIIEMTVPMPDCETRDRIMEMRSDFVSLDGRCLILTTVTPLVYGGLQDRGATLSFRQVMPPRVGSR